MNKLEQDEIQLALKDLEGWNLSDDGASISKSFKFKNFRAAWTFMEDIAVEANEMNHHPNWTNIYDTVSITLSTHDVGGLSELDFDLAGFIDTAEKVVSSEEF